MTDDEDENGRKGRIIKERNYFKTASKTFIRLFDAPFFMAFDVNAETLTALTAEASEDARQNWTHSGRENGLLAQRLTDV